MALKRSEEGGKKNEGGKGRRIVVEAAVKPKKQVYMHPGQFSFFPVLSTLFCDPFHLFP